MRCHRNSWLVMTFVVLALWWTLNVSTPPFTDSPPPSVSPPQHEATTTAVPTTSPVAEVSNEVARAKAAAKAARNQCRSMTSDAECDLLYGVIVTRDGSLLVPKQLNRHFAAKYPEGSGTFPPKKTRHHMKPVRVTIVDINDIDARRKRDVVNIQPDVVAFYQTPVIGAGFLNVWHTISDQYLMFTHTLDALLGAPKPKAEADDIKLVWVTESPMSVLKADPKYCTSLETCRRSALFTAFDALFQGLVMFAAEGASTAVAKLSVEGHDPSKLEGKEVRFEHLLLGLNYRCSPIPDLGVEAPVCHAALKVFKQRLLYGVGLDPHRRVTASELQCPIVHVMSRQKAKYRRIHNWDAYVAALTQSYVARQCDPARLQFITLSSKMSLAAQITTIWNVTILMAGRGGGTGYIPALPDGGGYFSISGSDRWSPYRLLTPDWINITHYRAKMTHEEDASRPCRRFRGVEDANRCGYFIENPQHLAEALWSFVDVLRARPRAQ